MADNQVTFETKMGVAETVVNGIPVSIKHGKTRTTSDPDEIAAWRLVEGVHEVSSKENNR